MVVYVDNMCCTGILYSVVMDTSAASATSGASASNGASTTSGASADSVPPGPRRMHLRRIGRPSNRPGNANLIW